MPMSQLTICEDMKKEIRQHIKKMNHASKPSASPPPSKRIPKKQLGIIK